MFVSYILNSGKYSRICCFHCIVGSLNGPQFCPTSKWNHTGTTFVNADVLKESDADLFIDNDNTIYVLTAGENEILVWYKNNTQPKRIYEEDSSTFLSIFVSDIGEIYVSLHDPYIIKWMSNTLSFAPVTSFQGTCFCLFIDVENYLYCSMFSRHIVEKTSLDNAMEVMLVAGTGNQGSDSDKLKHPIGIFVDTNLDLYVADYYNGRIQRFSVGNKNGETVAGKNSSDITFVLDQPHSIVLDAEKYLFISDMLVGRIIASGPNGFRCLVGCDRSSTSSHQLKYPKTFHFDIDKNMFVYDWGNRRIQKFGFQKDSCSKYELLWVESENLIID